MSRQVVFLAMLCVAVTGAAFLAVGVEAALCCAILSLGRLRLLPRRLAAPPRRDTTPHG